MSLVKCENKCFSSVPICHFVCRATSKPCHSFYKSCEFNKEAYRDGIKRKGEMAYMKDGRLVDFSALTPPTPSHNPYNIVA